MLRKNQQNGFSIIEVVVTLFIIGVTLVMFAMTANVVALNKQNKFKEIATRIASQEMQTLRTTPFGSMPSTGAISNSLLTSLPNGSGTRTVTVEDPDLFSITVTVSWRNPGASVNRTTSLSTYISRGGIGQ